jgi:hypothetical protein
MKIKELLIPILIDLEEAIKIWGEDKYEFENHEPHIELMYEDTYHDINDIYFIVEDDGDVVLRINTESIVDETQKKKYDLYRFLEDMEKVMEKYDKTFSYNWNDEGINIRYLD